MHDDIMHERNLVVAHLKDGRLLKGYTHDFSPVRGLFHLTSEMEKDKGIIYEIRTADLKALFFVKTLEGYAQYNEKRRFDEVDTSNLRGMKIKITFSDGEIVRGVSLGYSKNRQGFFVIPVDPQSNNERIYVLTDSVLEVKLGSAANK